MINPKLLDYVKSQIAQGTDNETIKQNLLSDGGWNSSDIDEAFKALMPSEAGNSIPVSVPQTTEPVIDDVEKSTNSYIWKNDKLLVAIYLIITIGSFAAIIGGKLDIRLVFIPFIIFGIGYTHVKKKIEGEFIRQFGASIGFTYSPFAPMSTVDGKLFKVGHSQGIYDILSGTLNDRSSRIFSYQFTVGGGKNSHTYYCTVFETAFSNNMPDIVLTTKTKTFLGSFPESNFFDGTEHIQLEGDFNKYFILKVPKGYETEAYQIFPPNVMADLIDKAKDLNFEFNGNKLYIYATSLILVREKLQAMFDLAEYLDNLFARSARAVDVSPTNL
jgi:hypothetical protein